MSSTKDLQSAIEQLQRRFSLDQEQRSEKNQEDMIEGQEKMQTDELLSQAIGQPAHQTLDTLLKLATGKGINEHIESSLKSLNASRSLNKSLNSIKDSLPKSFTGDQWKTSVKHGLSKAFDSKVGNNNTLGDLSADPTIFNDFYQKAKPFIGKHLSQQASDRGFNTDTEGIRDFIQSSDELKELTGKGLTNKILSKKVKDTSDINEHFDLGGESSDIVDTMKSHLKSHFNDLMQRGSDSLDSIRTRASNLFRSGESSTKSIVQDQASRLDEMAQDITYKKPKLENPAEHEPSSTIEMQDASTFRNTIHTEPDTEVHPYEAPEAPSYTPVETTPEVNTITSEPAFTDATDFSAVGGEL